MATNNFVEPEDARGMVLAQVGATQIDLKAKIQPLREVLEEIAPRGSDAKLREFIDQEIVIHSVQPFIGQYGPAAWVLFSDAHGELFNTVVGQRVVLPKLCLVMDRLPVKATVVEKEGGRFGRYYDIE